LKKGDPIVIIFGTNLPDITGCKDLTQTSVCALPGKIKTESKSKYALKSTKNFNKLKGSDF